MRDASLDEFLDEFLDEDGGTKGEAADSDAEPAVSTYDWTPGGAPCEACGAVVERRWRDGEQLVCEECKEW